MPFARHSREERKTVESLSKAVIYQSFIKVHAGTVTERAEDIVEKRRTWLRKSTYSQRYGRAKGRQGTRGKGVEAVSRFPKSAFQPVFRPSREGTNEATVTVFYFYGSSFPFQLQVCDASGSVGSA